MCGSTGYDVAFVLAVGGLDPSAQRALQANLPADVSALQDRYPLINGRGFPGTPITARKGQRILLRVPNLGSARLYTLTLLGLPMQVLGRGARQLKGPTGLTYYEGSSSVTVGAGETLDLLVDTSAAAPGTYFLYGTNFHRLRNDAEDCGGLMAEIVVTP
jgi:FtsP/CotA-like multicopper oxidase with cupredoxin domain